MYIGVPSEEEKNLISNVEAMIPSMKKDFYDSKLAGMDVFQLLRRSQENQVNIKLQGPTGAGKTTIFEAYCERTKQPHFVSNMKGSTTSEELVGAFVPNDSREGGAYVWKDGVIVRAVRYSNLWIKCRVQKNLIGTSASSTFFPSYTFIDKTPANYILDVTDQEIAKEDVISIEEDIITVKAWPMCMLTIEEINFSPEELMSVWFSLLDLRRNIVLNEKNGEVIKAGKFLSVNATMNPDYIGTNPLNEALNDRFLIKLNVDYDTTVENKIITKKGKQYDFDVADIKTLKKFIQIIRKGNRADEIRGNISTRMIEAFLDIKGKFGDEVAETSLFNSFSEEDRKLAKEAFALAKSESNTINVNAAELEGLDLASFRGFKPPVVKSPINSVVSPNQAIPKKSSLKTKAPF
jgi:MoxR-like ATPase